VNLGQGVGEECLTYATWIGITAAVQLEGVKKIYIVTKMLALVATGL